MKLETNTRIELITPQVAEDYLRRNHINRRLRPDHVVRIRKLMEQGEWHLTHQGIAFDSQGNLLDGQHRLTAIVQLGVPVKFMVTRNLSPEVFTSLDSGMGRTLTDRTNLPQKRVEVLNILQMIWRHASLAYKSTPRQIMEMNEVFGATCGVMEESCTTVRGMTCRAPIRAAVILCLHEGDTSVIRKYKSMVALEFESMPPAVQSLVRQMMRMHSGGSSASREDLFIRSLSAFDPKTGDNSKIQIKDLDYRLAAAQSRIADIMQEAAA